MKLVYRHPPRFEGRQEIIHRSNSPLKYLSYARISLTPASREVRIFSPEREMVIMCVRGRSLARVGSNAYQMGFQDALYVPRGCECSIESSEGAELVEGSALSEIDRDPAFSLFSEIEKDFVMVTLHSFLCISSHQKGRKEQGYHWNVCYQEKKPYHEHDKRYVSSRHLKDIQVCESARHEKTGPQWRCLLTNAYVEDDDHSEMNQTHIQALDKGQEDGDHHKDNRSPVHECPKENEECINHQQNDPPCRRYREDKLGQLHGDS